MAPVLLFILGLWLAARPVLAGPPEPPPAPARDPAAVVERLARQARPSVVLVLAAGRDGKAHGVGTGFVVSRDGLIATNLHVIGEGRPITIQTADGKKHEATAVEASDRHSDLAVVRIAARDLPALPLADSDTLRQGQEVVALGNPQGLEYSIVRGVVSARREIDGHPMIQVAIPIEPGNSGGPLLDFDGKVHGVLTLKSAVTANLGFAMPSNDLKPLLAKPNPVPLSRWLTIGALDPEEWTPLFGARWRQRAGRLEVEGAGQGFGGRSLCLSKRPTPPLPFELAVSVKLDDEAGAAGLAFHADGADRHYGFYPSAGKLRLTRFDGPDVFSWKILHDEPSPHYRPGEWNHLKVKVSKGKIEAYCNGQKVLESSDDGLASGRVGLAKFRDTRAEFKGFAAGPNVPAGDLSPEAARRVAAAVKDLPSDSGPVLDKLAAEGPAGVAALRQQARELEQRAARLRALAREAHHRRALADLARAAAGPDDKIDLLRAALLVARLDNEDLDPEPYVREVDRLARDVKASLPPKADEAAVRDALTRHLFQERGFHGSRHDYYHRSNSYLNEVLDDREGLPITLAILYVEIARRLGLNMQGVGLPGHFVVRHVPRTGEPVLLDVFDGGAVLPRDKAAVRVQAQLGRLLRESDLAPMPRKQVLVRLVRNLLNVARDEKDVEGALRYLDAILAIDPHAGSERWARAVIRFQLGRRQGVLEDTDWLLEHLPPGVSEERILELRQLAERSR